MLPGVGYVLTHWKISIDRIYNQAYKTRNQEVRTINYFPGEVFSRMKEIEGYCKLEKNKDSTFRYQIHIGHNDLLLKIKRGDQQF